VELWSGRAVVDRAAFKGRGGVGYVGQAPWVVGGTIRDNVLLGEPYEPGWMREVRARG
jgi:ABC-type multidrug transport system fused ATPase/permease subunit